MTTTCVYGVEFPRFSTSVKRANTAVRSVRRSGIFVQYRSAGATGDAETRLHIPRVAGAIDRNGLQKPSPKGAIGSGDTAGTKKRD